MLNVIIRSKESAAMATALLLSVRGHRVAVVGDAVAKGTHDIDILGEKRSTALMSPGDLDDSHETVGIVFAEGEDVESGFDDVFGCSRPVLLIVVGGGLSAPVEAARAAKAYSFPEANLIFIAGFPITGTSTSVTSEKIGIPIGYLAGISERSVKIVEALFPTGTLTDFGAAILSNLNAYFHVPPMLLNAMSIERCDDLRFYVDAFGDSVCRLIEALDEERLAIGASIGTRLMPVEESLDQLYANSGMSGRSLREKVNTFPPYQGINLPSSLGHRFLSHEIRATLAPMAGLAHLVGVGAPTTSAVVRIGGLILGPDLSCDASDTAEGFLDLALRAGTP